MGQTMKKKDTPIVVRNGTIEFVKINATILD